MKLEQLTQCMAATLASLFLILTLCTFHLERSQSGGERLILTKVIFDCGDGEERFFRLGEGQTSEVNGVPMATMKATPYIAQSMQNRVERAVYFSAAPNASMANAEAVLARLRKDTPDMFIFAVTSREMDLMQRTMFPLDPNTPGKDACISAANPGLLFKQPDVPAFSPVIEYQPIL